MSSRQIDRVFRKKKNTILKGEHYTDVHRQDSLVHRNKNTINGPGPGPDNGPGARQLNAMCNALQSTGPKGDRVRVQQWHCGRAAKLGL